MASIYTDLRNANIVNKARHSFEGAVSLASTSCVEQRETNSRQKAGAISHFENINLIAMIAQLLFFQKGRFFHLLTFYKDKLFLRFFSAIEQLDRLLPSTSWELGLSEGKFGETRILG